ncbi:hypothetical protein LCGC14_2555860, partial [marine sediment metagenome]
MLESIYDQDERVLKAGLEEFDINEGILNSFTKEKLIKILYLRRYEVPLNANQIRFIEDLQKQCEPINPDAIKYVDE